LEALNFLLQLLRVLLYHLVVFLKSDNLVPDHIHGHEDLLFVFGNLQAIYLGMVIWGLSRRQVHDAAVLDEDGNAIAKGSVKAKGPRYKVPKVGNIGHEE
jgi:hypothetical protein